MGMLYCVVGATAGKTIRIVSPASVDFRDASKRLGNALLDLELVGVRPSPPLSVIFEFDQRDALLSYDKYVRTH